jgi:GNAT superfamily N-acetyltransferase
MHSLQLTASRLDQHPAKLHRPARHRPTAATPRPARSDRIRIVGLEHRDSDALLAMLGRCSPLTLYRRFHGITDGVAYARHVLGTADRHDSYVAWSDDRCVGLGSLHVCENQAEIGVLVEDSWQRRGVGTALLGGLVGRARQHGLSSLRADVLGENSFTLPVLGRVGPTRTSLATGSFTVLVDLDAGSASVPSRSEPSASSPNRFDLFGLEALPTPAIRTVQKGHR